MRTKNPKNNRDLENRLLAFIGGLLFDATAHLASGAVSYLFGHRRRVRRTARGFR